MCEFKSPEAGITAAPIVLQPFDPDQHEANNFVTHFELVSRAQGWNDQTKCLQFPLFLHPTPFQWYLDYSEQPSTLLITWTILRDAFLNAFTNPQQAEDAEEQIRTRKWLSNESLDKYFFEILRLCRLANKQMTTQQKIVHITRGLPQTITQFVLSKDFDDIRKFRQYLHRIRNMNNTIASRINDPQINSLTSVSTNILQCSQQSTSIRTSGKLNHRSTPYSKSIFNGSNKNRYKGAVTNTGKPICFNCQNVGHLASTCKNEPFCRYCRKQGHTILSCETRPEKTSSSHAEKSSGEN